MKVSKKTAAIISATIMNYISTEEEAARQGQMSSAKALAVPNNNVWGMSGRQDIMQMRSLMQFRTFNKAR
jgi:hypothetical protein